MTRVLRWLVGVPLIVLAVVFAIANRQWVTLSLDPFFSPSRLSIDLPLWGLFFSGVLPGLLVGWIACWLAQGKWRRSAREAQRQLARQVSQPKPQTSDIMSLTELPP